MIASSHPFPSGAPQAVYGSAATEFSDTDIRIAAISTTAAAPPHHRWPF